MTLGFLQTAPTDLYNTSYLPIAPSSALVRVDRLRAIASSNYSVSHRLREMLLTRVLLDGRDRAPEELFVIEQVLAEGQRIGTLWSMDVPAVAIALIAATNELPHDVATQVVDLLLQGLVRTSLPASGKFESAAA